MNKLFLLLVIFSQFALSQTKLEPVKVLHLLKDCRQGDSTACDKKNTAEMINRYINQCEERGLLGRQSKESKEACITAKKLLNDNEDLKSADASEYNEKIQLAIPDKKLRKPASSETNDSDTNSDDGDCDNCG